MLASLYALLSSLTEQLSEYEDALIQLNQIATELQGTIGQVEGLKGISLEILAVDDKPYKEGLINSSKSNLDNAYGYITGTAIPQVQKKIAELKERIKALREEIARLEEERRRQEEEQNNNNN